MLPDNASGAFATAAEKQAATPDLKDLHAKIGRQAPEIDFLAGAPGLPVVGQVQLPGLSRSSVYYLPQPTPESDLRLMRRMDELPPEPPFAGARMQKWPHQTGQPDK